MKFYINISQLGKEETECNEPDCCRLTFFGKNILITEKFFNELLFHKNVMLIPELHDKENLIFNFSNYFQKTIDFTVFSVVENEYSKVLQCELNSYNNFDENDNDYPF